MEQFTSIPFSSYPRIEAFKASKVGQERIVLSVPDLITVGHDPPP
ncbi:MAG: hypothetical protein ACTSWN_13255 [Promethearchaeota archaeon]